MFAESRVPVIVVESDGRLVTANAAAVAQYGWTLDELVTMNIRDFQASVRAELEEDLTRAFRSDAAPLDRRPHRRKDGSILWVVPAAGAVAVEGETLIVSALQDVTAALLAEQRARDASESALRERQLLLNAVVAMLGERELVPALRILARSFAHAIGRPTTVWLPERKGSRVMRLVAWDALDEESLRSVADIRIDLDREGGARRAWETGFGHVLRLEDLEPGTIEHATAVRLGTGIVAPLAGRSGTHGLLYGGPVSDHEAARAVMLATTLGTFGGLVLDAVQLEERAKVMWAAASEHLPDGVVLLDSSLRIVRVNSAERRLLGTRGEGMLGRLCSEVFDVCADSPRCVHRVALEERTRQVREITGRDSRRPFRIEVIPADENDADVAVIHVAHDLSEERAVRTQLVTNERLASIGRLAAGVAHEINNPAAFVTVNLGVLRDRYAAGTARTQDVLAILDDSINGMDRIRDIVRDLKGLARDRSIDVVDLGVVAQSALRMAAHETRGRGRVNRVAEEGALARVRGARITQVVLNLVLNAAQALPPGRAENRISVRTRRAGDRVLLEVADNGPGIDQATAPRIFEPFFTTREAAGGTGLGLWLARSIVDEEGGTLTFHEEPGGGACFVVDLPAAPPGAAPGHSRSGARA
jgi:PAS domain S-box-containing protein